MKERVEGIERGTMLFDHLIHPQTIRAGTTRYVPTKMNARIIGNML